MYNSLSRAPLLGASRWALRTPPDRAYTHLLEGSHKQEGRKGLNDKDNKVKGISK